MGDIENKIKIFFKTVHDLYPSALIALAVLLTILSLSGTGELIVSGFVLFVFVGVVGAIGLSRHYRQRLPK